MSANMGRNDLPKTTVEPTVRSASQQKEQTHGHQDHRFLRRDRQRGRRDRARRALRPRRRRGLARLRPPHPRGRRAREDVAQTRRRSCSSAAPRCSATRLAASHVVTDRSTPEGLAALAEREGAEVIVFCSDSHTAKGHVAIGNSAQRLLEGGRDRGRDRAGRPRRGRRRAACSGSSPSATPDGGARGDRRGARRGARRARSRRSPTSRPTCS